MKKWVLVNLDLAVKFILLRLTSLNLKLPLIHGSKDVKDYSFFIYESETLSIWNV